MRKLTHISTSVILLSIAVSCSSPAPRTETTTNADTSTLLNVSETPTIAGFEFEQRDMPVMTIAGIRETVQLTDFSSAKFANWFGAIGKTLEKERINPVGAPMAIYYSYDSIQTEMEAAIPVASAGKDVGAVKFHEIPASKAIVVKYLGSYENMKPVYDAAFDYINKNGLEFNGYPMEIYVTDPMNEPDTVKWLTEIMFPIK